MKRLLLFFVGLLFFASLAPAANAQVVIAVGHGHRRHYHHRYYHHHYHHRHYYRR